VRKEKQVQQGYLFSIRTQIYKKAVPIQTVPTQTILHFKNKNTGTFSTPPYQPQHADQDKPTTNTEAEKWRSTPASASQSLTGPSQLTRFSSPGSCSISAKATKSVVNIVQKSGMRSPIKSTGRSLGQIFHSWMSHRSKPAMVLYVSFLLSLVDGGGEMPEY